MFKKAHNYSNIESLISQGVEIKGEIKSPGSIRIDGLVEGKLSIKGDLIVGEKGFIKGDVKTDNLILAGKIEGNIEAKGRFEIKTTGTMTGDASCSILSIEEGAHLEGTSRMNKGKEKSEEKK
ncbi:MAG: polymer-forming cytoskeletal protein [Syntrophomonadaceae bacterium]|nr:polymer-forming cytoskeletal protein [Syntrophomonadaceae bacterium]MDD3023536.1 polymer-forming cytoskeletal protein [Syntrophomonadaceae bacterium]